MRKIKIGIVGCGDVSRIYLNNLKDMFRNTDVCALCDLDESKAKARANEYSVPRVLLFDEMINDSEIELIINITTPKAHYSLSKQALLAGKHVYIEKPLSLTYTQAQDLVDTAKQKEVLLAGAPDTFLGSGYQTARNLIDQGLIGKVLSASTFDVNHGHENWHPNPSFFYEEGGGPIFDRGPYNLTTLISLIGSIRTVSGMTGTGFEKRTITSAPKYGQLINVEIPTHICGLLEFENGALCTMTMSFDVWGSTVPHTELHGTLGSLILPDPNSFTGEILYKSYFGKEFQAVPHTHIYSENSRGIGVCDMANAIMYNKKPRANGEMACHVVEIMEALHTSWKVKECIQLHSRCERPAPLPIGLCMGYTEIDVNVNNAVENNSLSSDRRQDEA